MICSDARLAANRMNSLKSTGPKTEEGKAISRRNGLKHGLTGEGVVVPEGEAEEVARLVEALTDDMRPRSPAGSLMIARMATLSVRAERAARRESVAIAVRVRHAVDDFDEARVEEADRLFEALGEDPRKNLRRLRKSPEGIVRLIEAWTDLRDDLARGAWTAEHLERAAPMTGLRAEVARDRPLGALSRAVLGDFAALTAAEGGGLGDEARRAWAKARLLERITAEVDELAAHHATLDFETIELDRLDAPALALFDPSKEATLARRYESEAERGFYKALKECRQAEAEHAARAGAPQAPAPAPSRASTATRMASPRESTPTADLAPARAYPEASIVDDSVVRGPDGRPLVVGRPAQTPR